MLDRTQPVRRWAREPEERDPALKASGEHAEAPVVDPVADGVQLGYRVVEEYLRHGQQVARMVAGQALPGAGTGVIQEAMERTARSIAELASLWFSQASMTAPNPMAAAGTSARVVPSTGPSVRVRVLAAVRTEVRVDLQPGAETCSVACHPLHSAVPQAPPLSAVGFERSEEDGALCFHIEVPALQPPGTYCGVVVDTGGDAVRGTVTVRLGERT